MISWLGQACESVADFHYCGWCSNLRALGRLPFFHLIEPYHDVASVTMRTRSQIVRARAIVLLWLLIQYHSSSLFYTIDTLRRRANQLAQPSVHTVHTEKPQFHVARVHPKGPMVQLFCWFHKLVHPIYLALSWGRRPSSEVGPRH
jgi:hypothetical protein